MSAPTAGPARPTPVRHPADDLPTMPLPAMPPTVPLPAEALPVRPAVRPAGCALDAGQLHGWGWVPTPLPAPAAVPAGWGWATVRGDGKGWAVAGAPALHRRPPRRGLLREWSRRYLLAEGVGTLCAVLAALLVLSVTDSLATAAVAASIAESAAYYAVVLRRMLPAIWRRHRGSTLGRRLVRTVRDTVGEASDFLTAELLDTILLRPLLIWLAAGWTGPYPVLGLIIGKLLADLAFYAVVIPSYELRKKLAPR